MRRIVIALLVCVPLHAEEEPERLICVMSGAAPIRFGRPDCTTLISRELRVEPGLQVGSIIVVDPARGVLLTVMPPGQAKLPLSLPDLVPVTVALASNSRRAPVEVTIRVESDAGKIWTWMATGKDAAKPRFSAAPGRYRISLSAPHHAPSTLPWFEVASRAITLRPSALKAVPHVRGRVVEGSRSVALARVSDERDAILGFTDKSGSFVVDLTDHWPELLRIEAPGIGMKHVELPPTPQVDLDLGIIELASAGSLHLTAIGDSVSGKTSVVLMRPENLRTVAQKSLDSKTRDAIFDNLEPERYIAQLRGSQPFQRFGKAVTIDHAALRNVTMRIDPAAVHFRIFLGDHRLPHSTLRLQNAEGKWDGSLTTDDEGEATAEFWQTGEVLASVTSSEVGVPHVEVLTIDAGTIDIHLPDARLRGTVVETGTGKPVADAEVGLRSESGEITTSLRTRTDDAGRFEYRSLRPGHHSVIATAPGFIKPASVEFDLTPEDSSRDIAVSMTRGVSGTIRIVDARGAPLPKAAMAEVAGARFLEMRNADDSGAATLTIPDGESRTLVIVPREGSFAVVHVDAKQLTTHASDPLILSVPDATASLTVKTQSSRGEPVADVVLALRYNGLTLPLEIVQILDRVQGTRFVTDGSGVARLLRIPSGVYELQPLWKRSEAEAGGLVNRARVDVQPGENSAILSFAASDRRP